LNAGEILDTAIRLYRKNFVAFFGIAAIPLLALTVLNIFWLLNYESTSVIDLVQSLLVGNFITFALTKAISNTYLGKPVTILGSYRIGWKRFGSLLGALFLEGIIVAAPLILFVCLSSAVLVSAYRGYSLTGVQVLTSCLILPCAIWAIFFSTRYIAVTPSIIAEDESAAGSLRRSWELTRGVWWRVFGIMFAVGLLVYLVSGLPATIVTAFVTYTRQVDTTTGLILVEVISQLGTMIAMPVQLAVNTLIYYDLRVRKEGYDLELMAQQMSEAG
jgi:hypothetical protein